MSQVNFLLPIAFILALNTWSLFRRWRVGESATYDGEEAPVVIGDVMLSAAFAAVLVAYWLFDWWREHQTAE
jgi:hypothetical protein